MRWSFLPQGFLYDDVLNDESRLKYVPEGVYITPFQDKVSYEAEKKRWSGSPEQWKEIERNIFLWSSSPNQQPPSYCLFLPNSTTMNKPYGWKISSRNKNWMIAEMEELYYDLKEDSDASRDASTRAQPHRDSWLKNREKQLNEYEEGFIRRMKDGEIIFGNVFESEIKNFQWIELHHHIFYRRDPNYHVILIPWPDGSPDYLRYGKLFRGVDRKRVEDKAYDHFEKVFNESYPPKPPQQSFFEWFFGLFK